MPRLTVDGIELHYEERGAGPPIVFSHGLLWSRRMFAAQLDALSARFRCIAYDHRGQGESASSPAAYDMERLTDDAAALIEKLGAAPCHFVGLSMGGFVGLRLAARRPALLRSLTLVESAADGEPWLNGPKYRVMEWFARRFGFGPLVPLVMRIMFGRTFLGDPARAALRAKMAAELGALDVDRVHAALEAVIRRRPVLDEVARLGLPVQLIHGEEDRAITPARARRTATAVPGCRLVMVPRAGHTSSVEEPEAVTRAIAELVDRV